MTSLVKSILQFSYRKLKVDRVSLHLNETFGFQDVGRVFPDTCTVLRAVNQGHFQPRSQGSLLLKGASLEVKRVLQGTGVRHFAKKKCDSCRHSSASFSENVLVAKTSFSFCDSGEGSTSFCMCEKTKKEIKLSRCVFS